MDLNRKKYIGVLLVLWAVGTGMGHAQDTQIKTTGQIPGPEERSKANEKSYQDNLDAFMTLCDQLNLQKGEAEEVIRINQEKNDQVVVLKREIFQTQVRIAQAMKADEPDLKQIEAWIRGQQDAELGLRMIAIEKQIKIHKVLGTQRWAILLRYLRTNNIWQDNSSLIQSVSRDKANKARLFILMMMLMSMPAVEDNK